MKCLLTVNRAESGPERHIRKDSKVMQGGVVVHPGSREEGGVMVCAGGRGRQVHIHAHTKLRLLLGKYNPT